MRNGISVFFPAYNDEHTIGGLVRTVLGVLPGLCEDFEVIVVNDGSRDGTARVLEALSQEFPGVVRIVTHPENRGYGGALRSGFQAATKDLVFYTDGDGQYDPAELQQLHQRMGPNTGLVNGYKLQRHDPAHRVMIGWLYNRFARTIFGIGIRDIDCDFRLVRRSLLDEMELRSTSGTICVELVKKLELCPYLVEEVGVNHYPRQFGRSQFFRVKALLSTFFELLRLYASLAVVPKLTGKDARIA